MKKFLFFLLIAIISSREPDTNRAPISNTSPFGHWLSGLEPYLQDTYNRLEEKDLFLKIKQDLMDGNYKKKAVKNAKKHCKKDTIEEQCKEFVDEYNLFLKNQ